MKDKEKGILNKCSTCGKQLKIWSLYCKECKDVNNKFVVCDDKKKNNAVNNIA